MYFRIFDLIKVTKFFNSIILFYINTYSLYITIPFIFFLVHFICIMPLKVLLMFAYLNIILISKEHYSMPKILVL